MSKTERGALLHFFLHFLGSTFEAVDDDGSQQRPTLGLGGDEDVVEVVGHVAQWWQGDGRCYRDGASAVTLVR